VAVILGWVFFVTDRETKMTWRSVIAMIASIYLIVSIPVFWIETHVRLLMRYPWHRWLSMYVEPWVHWGIFLILSSIICSFLGRGRARIAFVTGAALLLVLRLAMGTWFY
jgi:hypothetical protein